MASTKQAVIKALVNANLLSTFDRDAVNCFVAFVDDNGGSPDAIASVIQAVRGGAARDGAKPAGAPPLPLRAPARARSRRGPAGAPCRPPSPAPVPPWLQT
jgi:hypothetical protein